MSVGAGNKQTKSGTTSVTNIDTDSVAFTVGNLYLLTLRARCDATNWVDGVWTLGTTGTWTEIVPTGGRVVCPDDPMRGSIMWRYLPGSSPTGVVNLALTGDTFGTWVLSIDEFVGHDTGGSNGADAIVQATKATKALGASSPVTVTLGAFGSASNATYGSFAWGGNNLTVGSGFTQYGFLHTTSDGILTEFRNDNDTSVDTTFSGVDTRVTAIAVEIKAAAAGTSSSAPPQPIRRMLRYLVR